MLLTRIIRKVSFPSLPLSQSLGKHRTMKPPLRAHPNLVISTTAVTPPRAQRNTKKILTSVGFEPSLPPLPFSRKGGETGKYSLKACIYDRVPLGYQSRRVPGPPLPASQDREQEGGSSQPAIDAYPFDCSAKRSSVSSEGCISGYGAWMFGIGHTVAVT